MYDDYALYLVKLNIGDGEIQERYTIAVSSIDAIEHVINVQNESYGTDVKADSVISLTMIDDFVYISRAARAMIQE